MIALVILLPRVTVTLDQQEIVTDADGVAKFSLIAPGKHVVRAELEGFKVSRRKIAVGDRSEFTVNLKLEASQPVTIACPSLFVMPEPFSFTASRWSIQGVPLHERLPYGTDP